jgi:hypothetical protein
MVFSKWKRIKDRELQNPSGTLETINKFKDKAMNVFLGPMNR